MSSVPKSENAGWTLFYNPVKTIFKLPRVRRTGSSAGVCKVTGIDRPVQGIFRGLLIHLKEVGDNFLYPGLIVGVPTEVRAGWNLWIASMRADRFGSDLCPTGEIHTLWDVRFAFALVR